MAPKKSTRKGVPGRDHELLVKAVYKALLNQDQVKSLEIRQNAKIQGTHSRHQVDVYWRFRSAGIDYQTIVQVKKEKRRATKGDIHTFEGVLKDISGQPKGIFVTQAGYQRGALTHARGVGINLFEFSQPAAVPNNVMTNLSQAKLELLPEALAMRVTVYHTKVRHMNLVVDEIWLKHLGFSLMPRVQPTSITELALVDDWGKHQETLHSRVQKFVGSNSSGGELQIEFTEPTYLLGFHFLDTPERTVGPIKLLRMILLVDVNETVQMKPL